MLTAIGWTIGIALCLLIAGTALYFWLIPSDPFGTTTRLTTAMTDMDASFYEQRKRVARELRLMHLQTDLEHARRLMDLEEDAGRLKARYARHCTDGVTYSPDVEGAMREFFDAIDKIKQGHTL